VTQVLLLVVLLLVVVLARLVGCTGATERVLLLQLLLVVLPASARGQAGDSRVKGARVMLVQVLGMRGAERMASGLQRVGLCL
jgi:hypothetical protein